MENNNEAEASRRCTECPHVFTPQELAAEDPKAWGHPCYGKDGKDERFSACESYREVAQYEQPSTKQNGRIEQKRSAMRFGNEPPRTPEQGFDLEVACGRLVAKQRQLALSDRDVAIELRSLASLVDLECDARRIAAEAQSKGLL